MVCLEGLCCPVGRTGLFLFVWLRLSPFAFASGVSVSVPVFVFYALSSPPVAAAPSPFMVVTVLGVL